VDERRDVLKSTQAAVQFLKELNNQYGSWHLAAAAYNAGPGKIQRAIRKHKTTDFWEMCRYRYLKPETKNYVPKLFAAAIVAKNRQHFGFKEHYVDELKEANADKNSVVGRVAPTTDEAELAKLPDQLDEDAKPIVSVPEDKAASDDDDDALLAEDSVEKMLKSLPNDDNVLTPHVNKNGAASGEVLTVVDIPSPANLLQVAKAAGMSYNDFKSMNPELLRWVTPPQMKQYRIKVPLHARDSFIRSYFAKDFDRSVDFLQYKARKGDSVKSIARRFKINPDPVAQMNGINVKSMAPAGRLLELPIPRDHVRSLASLKELELYDPPDPKRPRMRRSRKGGRRVEQIRRQKTTALRYRSGVSHSRSSKTF
jgi:LysM repeat protein